jgi:hypothetical protein
MVLLPCGSHSELLIFVLVVGVFAVAAKPEEELNENSKDVDEVPPQYGHPQLTMLGGFTVFIPIAMASWFGHSKTIALSVSSVSIFLLAIYSFYMHKLSLKVPNMLEAEAVAWLLELSQDPEAWLFETVGGIATNTWRKVVLLLETTLSLFPHMIAVCLQHRSGEYEHELHMLLAFLAHLSDFRDAKGTWRLNRATLKHPEL